MKNQKIKMGAIGCGRIFNHAHLPVYVERNDVNLIGFYDKNKSKAKKSLKIFKDKMDQTKYNLGSNDKPEVYESLDELFNAVDAVDISTPPKWHTYYAKKALQKGVHASVEKPMAISWWKAYDLMKTAEKSNLIFQLNDDNVFLKRYNVIKNIVESEEIGKVVSIWLSRGCDMHKYNLDWNYNPKISGGGALMDYGSHGMAGAWYILGFDKIPEEVYSLKMKVNKPWHMVNGILQETHIDDDVHFQVIFRDRDNNSNINVIEEATWSGTEYGSRGGDINGFIEVKGDKGRITDYSDEEGVNYLKLEKWGYGTKLIELPNVEGETQSFFDMIGNFVKCIENSQQSVLNAEIGAKIMAILDSVYLSNLEDRSVRLEELKDYRNKFKNKYENEKTAEKKFKEKLLSSLDNYQ